MKCPHCGKDIDLSPESYEKPNGKEQNRIRKIVAEMFVEKTGLPLPEPTTKKERLAAGTLWYQPIRQICEMSQWNLKKAVGLTGSSIDRLTNGNQVITISDPNSILKTARGIIGEINSGRFRG